MARGTGNLSYLLVMKKYHLEQPLRTALIRLLDDSVSLKTTVPETYVRLLKLTNKDQLEWDHEIKKDGAIILKVRAIKDASS